MAEAMYTKTHLHRSNAGDQLIPIWIAERIDENHVRIFRHWKHTGNDHWNSVRFNLEEIVLISNRNDFYLIYSIKMLHAVG